jgi:hypothetical protein
MIEHEQFSDDDVTAMQIGKKAWMFLSNCQLKSGRDCIQVESQSEVDMKDCVLHDSWNGMILKPKSHGWIENCSFVRNKIGVVFQTESIKWTRNQMVNNDKNYIGAESLHLPIMGTNLYEELVQYSITSSGPDSLKTS